MQSACAGEQGKGWSAARLSGKKLWDTACIPIKMPPDGIPSRPAARYFLRVTRRCDPTCRGLVDAALLPADDAARDAGAAVSGGVGLLIVGCGMDDESGSVRVEDIAGACGQRDA